MAITPIPAHPVVARKPVGAAPAGRAPAPKAPVKATGGEEYDASTPEAFKHTVVKWVGYVQDARARVTAAKGKLAAARAAEAESSKSLEGPLVAARQALAGVEGPLQAELDRRVRALADARAALDDAVYPNKARAAALEGQAAAVQRDIDDHEASIRRIRDQIERLDPGSSWYRSETSRLNYEITSHQDDVERLSRQRFDLIRQANELRNVQRDPADPTVVTARARVAQATEAVATAQAAHRDGIAPYVDRVDAAQQNFNRAMAQARAATADAERTVALAEGEARRVEEAMARVPKQVGFFKNLWWKLVEHFDARAYFREQAGV